MSVMLDASAKGVIMTYKASIFDVPVIVTATGIEEWLSIDNIEAAVMEVGTDGTLLTHVKPAMVKGKITVQPLSPVLVSSFISVMENQYRESRAVSGTLTVAAPSNAWVVTFNNFVLTSYFKGYELAEKIKDVEIEFSAQLPDATLLGDLLGIGEAIAGLHF